MFRRDFLGSIIAGLVIVPLPFRALLDHDEWQRVIDPRFRMLYKLEDGYIQAPGVYAPISDGNKFVFQTEMFMPTQTMVVSGGVLLNAAGKTLSEFDFYSSVPLLAGDKLNTTYTLNSDCEISLDSAIQHLEENPLLIKRKISNSRSYYV